MASLLSSKLVASSLRRSFQKPPMLSRAPLSRTPVGSVTTTATVARQRLLSDSAATARFPHSPKIITTTTTKQDFARMTNDQLADTSTIPGWDLIHSPPRTFPRGALLGTVVSTKMNKTVNVQVDRYRMVPKIRKRMKYTRKFMAHDEKEVAHKGDLVMITPCHRISKRKHFMLREIIRPKGHLY